MVFEEPARNAEAKRISRRSAAFSSEGPIHQQAHHNVTRMRDYVTLSLAYGDKPFLVNPAAAEGVKLYPYPEVKKALPGPTIGREYLLAPKVGLEPQEFVHRFMKGLRSLSVPLEDWEKNYGVRFYAHGNPEHKGLIAYVYKEKEDAEGPAHALFSLHADSDDALRAFHGYLNQVAEGKIPFSLAHHERGRATTSRVQWRRQSLKEALELNRRLLELLRKYHERTREDPTFNDLAQEAKPHIEKHFGKPEST